VANYNRVILAGNLTRDPELRYTQSGLAVARIGLAVNERFTSGGEQRERTLFIDCTAFGKRAEVMSEYLSKGRAVLIDGRLVLETWTSQDGQKRSKHSVTIDNFQFLVGRGQEAREGTGPPPGRRSGPPPSGKAPDESSQAGPEAEGDSGFSLDDDDIPF
jgi:single-strand DNA-binding protein